MERLLGKKISQTFSRYSIKQRDNYILQNNQQYHSVGPMERLLGKTISRHFRKPHEKGKDPPLPKNDIFVSIKPQKHIWRDLAHIKSIPQSIWKRRPLRGPGPGPPKGGTVTHVLIPLASYYLTHFSICDSFLDMPEYRKETNYELQNVWNNLFRK